MTPRQIPQRQGDGFGGSAIALDNVKDRKCKRGFGGSRQFIPSSPIKLSSRFLFIKTTPLLEKEWHAHFIALCADISNPVGIHRACARTRFAAHNHPIDILQLQFWKWSKQWLKREEFDRCSCSSEIVNTKR